LASLYYKIFYFTLSGYTLSNYTLFDYIAKYEHLDLQLQPNHNELLGCSHGRFSSIGVTVTWYH